MTTDDVLTRLRAVERRGADWVLAQIDDEGRPAGSNECNAYHLFPLALAYAGHRGEASRVLSWMEREVLTQAGDLREGVARDAWVGRLASAPLASIVQGACVVERYDTSSVVMDTLATFQAENGGAYSQRPEGRTSDRQFIYDTSLLGISALMLGRLAVAEGVYRWLRRLYDAQPDPVHVLYNAWESGSLLSDPGADWIQKCITDFRLPRQAYCNPGIAVVFLVRYHMLTRSSDSLVLAHQLLAFHARGSAEQWDFRTSTQLAEYGAGLAHMVLCDPRPAYVEHLVRMVDWFQNSQRDDGSWVPSPFLFPHPTAHDAMTKTTEHMVFVSMMCVALEAIGTGRRYLGWTGLREKSGDRSVERA